MKFRKFGRITLALAVSLGMGLGVTSCSTDHTVGYFYVTGTQYNQISGFRIDNNLGNLTPIAELALSLRWGQPHQGAGGQCGRFLYVLNAGCGAPGKSPAPAGTRAERYRSKYLAVHHRRQGWAQFPGRLYQPGQLPDRHTDGYFRHPPLCARFAVPDPTTCVAYVPTNPASVCGDITAFNIDPEYRPALADHQPAGEGFHTAPTSPTFRSAARPSTSIMSE